MVRVHAYTRVDVFLVSALLLVIGTTRSAEGQDAGSKEIEKLQGTWESEFTLGISGNKFTLLLANVKLASGTINVASEGKLMTIDLITESGTRKGVYEVDRDVLKICLGGFGKDRPKDFKTQKGDGFELANYRRKK